MSISFTVSEFECRSKANCNFSLTLAAWKGNRIFLYSDWIRRDTGYLSVFSPNTGKCGPEITPYLDTFHAVFTDKLNFLHSFTWEWDIWYFGVFLYMTWRKLLLTSFYHVRIREVSSVTTFHEKLFKITSLKLLILPKERNGYLNWFVW